jgi:hypothetical protein
MKLFFSLSYISVIAGSLGLAAFATMFGFATNLDEYRVSEQKFIGLNGAQVWIGSWILIIVGTVGQLVIFWIGS